MRAAVLLLAAAAAILAMALGAPTADQITALPGWSGALPSAQYSGYLDIPGGKHLHYWLVLSETDPSKAPLTIWLNGGPMCSSLDGYWYENGPLHFEDDDGSAIVLNPYRWSQNSSMLYLEMPAGVGFSYADTPSGIVTNDTQQAVDNYAALLQFYTKFPELRSQDLYISGESYAGMYVPTLALEILAHQSTLATPIPLKGILVGNGVTGIGSIPDSLKESLYTDFYYGHGLFSAVLMNQIRSECGDYSSKSQACQAALNEMHAQIGNINVYDLYEPCINSGMPGSYSRRPMEAFERALVGGPVGCIDAGSATAYLNTPTVRDAIHVLPASKIGNWTICADQSHYSVTRSSLLPDYKKTLIPSLRVLIYSGDVDACVPYVGSEWWTSSLDEPVKDPWHAWSVDGQVAGYATNYENDFSFVTVKGSGHMVPQFRPKQALAMFQRFVFGGGF